MNRRSRFRRRMRALLIGSLLLTAAGLGCSFIPRGPVSDIAASGQYGTFVDPAGRVVALRSSFIIRRECFLGSPVGVSTTVALTALPIGNDASVSGSQDAAVTEARRTMATIADEHGEPRGGGAVQRRESLTNRDGRGD